MTKKVLIIISFTCFIIFFGSCSTDENNDNNNNQQQQEEEEEMDDPPINLLLGIWRPNSFVFICNSGAIDQLPLEGCTLESRIVFETGDDPDNIFMGVYRDIPSATDSEGNCEQTGEFIGTWELIDEVLFISLNGNELEYPIMNLTDNTVRINNQQDPYTGTPCSDEDPGLQYLELERVE